MLTPLIPVSPHPQERTPAPAPPHADPAEVARRLRGRLAEHLAEREECRRRFDTLCNLIEDLGMLAEGLADRMLYLDLVIGRLDRMAAEHEADAARARGARFQ